MQRRAALILFSSSLLLAAACGDGGGGDTGARDTGFASGPVDTPGFAQDTPAAALAATRATAMVKDARGRDLGTLTLTAGGGGITISGQLSGLPPGEHGFHLHEVGRCEPPAFTSAGGHWNPTNRRHGFEWPEGPHLGDLPNLTVGQDSSVSVQATTEGGMLRGNQELLDGDGAAIVVHAKADDYESQPSGDSGDRIACGVVQGAE